MFSVVQLPLIAIAASGEILQGHVNPEVAAVQLRHGGMSPAPLKLLASTLDAINSEASGIEQSVVFFCVDWLEQCADLKAEFRVRGRALANKFNAQSLLVPRVRFAEVDCGEDKVACNQQQVETYPTVTLFVHGKRYRAWEGSLGAPRKKRHQSMIDWLNSHVGEEPPRKQDSGWPASLGPLFPQHAKGREAPPPQSANTKRNTNNEDAEEPSLASELRWAASVGAAIAVCIACVRYLLELVQFARAEVHRTTEGTTSLKKEDKQSVEVRAASVAEANTPSCRIARRLPKDWASQRRKIDL